MSSDEIRRRFVNFFEARGHYNVPSASLIPENDPSVLFVTAGMQPFVPYLLGEKHPKGRRLVNVQKVVRTVDIEEIGDDTHHTFFEMLGNWSLGDYFKEEAIQLSYELLTQEFGLNPKRLYITVFEGNENAPRDEESIEIWKSLGVPENRIYALPEENNWWSPGDNGPCGPDTEMFYDVTEFGLGDMTKKEFLEADKKQEVVEIWNDVFMEYEKRNGVVVGTLSQKNVDTGAGLERLARVLQGVGSNYDTDLFSPVVSFIEKNSKEHNVRYSRIIADHIRSSLFLVSDGVLPSNKDQGYVLRRLIRRAGVKAEQIGLTSSHIDEITSIYIDLYKKSYPNISNPGNREIIRDELQKFNKTLIRGLKRFKEGEDPFVLLTTYGFPIEITEELAKQEGRKIDRLDFDNKMSEHRVQSSLGSEKKFKGGLADHSEISLKYHTATHLLNAALRDILGSHVEQKGSNINADRMRFDFSHPKKLTEEEKIAIEEWVNREIKKDSPVTHKEMGINEARDMGALGVFGEKYSDIVKVYTIGKEGGVVSREICGGPHVGSTGVLGTFRIKKEESSSQGVRRIKAALE